MAKKTNSATDTSNDPALRALKNMRRLDTKKACVKMGMPFEEAAGASNLQLMSWFIKNFGNKIVEERLKAYDEWYDLLMIGKGYDPDDPKDSYLFHPSLKLSFDGNTDEAKQLKLELNNPKPKKLAPVKEAKKPKVKDEETGVIKGTKKAYTFKLAQNTEKDYSVARIIKKVIRKFPEANENSIKIWIKKARKA